MIRFLKPIILITVAASLFIVYIQPTFLEIRTLENETNDFSEAVSKAAQHNQLLASLVERKNSFTRAELERIEALAPDTIDEVSVMSDLQGIVLTNSMILSSIEAGEWTEVTSEAGDGAGGVSGLLREDEAALLDETDPARINNGGVAAATAEQTYIQKKFVMNVFGTYSQFKNLLQDIERSLLLMSVTDITFEAAEGSLGAYTITISVSKLK